MNDRFKFRAWDKLNKRMVTIRKITWAPQGFSPFIDGYAVKPFSDEEIKKQRERIGNPNWEDMHTEDLELMQSTDLKDKNGKLIYEGDILLYTRTNWCQPGHPNHNTDLKNRILITWEDCGFKENMYDEKRCFSSGYLSFEDDRAYENFIEIIGNVYENPELLNPQTHE